MKTGVCLLSCYGKSGIRMADMSAKANLARNLKARMELLGLTDSELARRMDNVAPITVGRWKRATAAPVLDDIEKLSKILGMSVIELLSPESKAAETLDVDAALLILSAEIARAKIPIK